MNISIDYTKREPIYEQIVKEVEKFSKALEEGHKEFEKLINGIEKHKEFAAKNGQVVENKLSGKAVFRLYDTFGFPFELTKNLKTNNEKTLYYFKSFKIMKK